MRLSAPPLPALLPAINLPEATPMSEQPSLEQTVRMLRAKAAELESRAALLDNSTAISLDLVARDIVFLTADIALVAQLLAEHIGWCQGVVFAEAVRKASGPAE